MKKARKIINKAVKYIAAFLMMATGGAVIVMAFGISIGRLSVDPYVWFGAIACAASAVMAWVAAKAEEKEERDDG